MIITAVIAILQVLTCLFCYWFVEFRVLMQCTKVEDAEKAEVVQVTPTPNNGFAELVYLHRKFIPKELNQAAEKVTWFQFQKTKYIFDSKEKKQFKPIEFPLNNTLASYMESKGYSQSEKQIQDALSYFDLNKMIMDVPKFVELFIERATAPFFVFQVYLEKFLMFKNGLINTENKGFLCVIMVFGRILVLQCVYTIYACLIRVHISAATTQEHANDSSNGKQAI